MEQVNMNIISFIHSNGLFFSIYNYFILFLLLFEIIGLIFLDNYFLKINKNINEDINEESPFISDLIARYNALLERQRDLVNTGVFINNYYLENNRLLQSLTNIIEHSDILFLLLGLFGAFIIILNRLISINFEVITNFQDLYSQFGEIIYSLKPALFLILVGIISAIVIKILTKLINIIDRVETIKKRLENHLENNVKYKYNRDLKELELLEHLIETINNGFDRLNNSIYNIESIEDKIKIMLDEYAQAQDYYNKEQWQQIKDIAITKEEES